MIVAIGTDLVAIARFERVLQERPERFVTRVFTESERSYCESKPNPAESYAARFAAKEAILKCLGTGWARGLGFQDIEVVRDELGAVAATLHGVAAERAKELGIAQVHVSISHAEDHALAFAVATV